MRRLTLHRLPLLVCIAFFCATLTGCATYITLTAPNTPSYAQVKVATYDNGKPTVQIKKVSTSLLGFQDMDIPLNQQVLYLLPNEYYAQLKCLRVFDVAGSKFTMPSLNQYGESGYTSFTFAVEPGKQYQLDCSRGEDSADFILAAAPPPGTAAIVNAAPSIDDPTNPADMVKLAHRYASGDGVILDKTHAANLLQKAADQGDANAQEWLGWMYENGYGLPKDATKAVDLYTKAVDQGNIPAMRNLYLMYEFGWGVTKDYSYALRLIQQAANLGDGWAYGALGYIL